MQNNLGGVMFWAPDLDDFSGNFCNKGQYPLMKAAVNIVKSGNVVPVTPPTAVTPTTTSRPIITGTPSGPVSTSRQRVVCYYTK